MRARSRKLLVGTAVAASSLLGSGARADDEREPSFGLGVFVGYRFAFDAQSGVEWGLEGFATYRAALPSCTSEPRHGLGPLAQLAVRDWFEDPRLTLALQGGGELQRAQLALSGELGVSYDFGEHGGFGVHTGFVPELVFFNAGFRYEWFLNQASLTAGLRAPPTYGQPYICQVGRPLRSEAGVWTWQHARLACDERAAVGQAFERDAQHELSSVPAFLQLASELVQVDAPASLVQRALRAARDEQLHTALCARLAGRSLQRPVALQVPEVTRRPQLNRRRAVLRLLRESWSDGCLGEGAAAEHAAVAAKRAGDAETRTVLTKIASDERRHAELAWSVLEWALKEGGEEARAELKTASEWGGGQIEDESAPEGLAERGRLGASALKEIAERHEETSRKRLRAVID
jgi:hypothetical protein